MKNVALFKQLESTYYILTLFLLVESTTDSDGGAAPVDPCGDVPLVLSGSNNGTIQSPNYPNDYPNGADCNWIVEVNVGRTVQLTVMNFELENR